MKESLQLFMKEYKSKGHMKQLLRNQSLTVCIKTEAEDICFVLESGNVYSANNRISREPEAKIAGKEEAIVSLLAGNIKLREAASQNLLRVSSSLRTCLLLEAIFYLSKTKEHVN